jgi:hypothetical protein
MGDGTHTLSAENIPPNWKAVTEASDFHVGVFKTDVPNSLIYAPVYNTINLLDECFYSATLAGQKLIVSKQCSAFEIKYRYASDTNCWPHISLTWTNDE